MEGRREDVETYFSSGVSPPCEGDDFYKIWPLPGICYGTKVNGPHLNKYS